MATPRKKLQYPAGQRILFTKALTGTAIELIFESHARAAAMRGRLYAMRKHLCQVYEQDLEYVDDLRALRFPIEVVSAHSIVLHIKKEPRNANQ